jgi:hypothetical protein
MPDTPENQAKYPQPGSQKEGCGFPVAGFVAVICLATGALLDAALGTWKTSEAKLFRRLRRHFRRGDIFLADRGFSSYAEIALFQRRGVDSVLRLHQKRKADFHSGRVVGVDDHVATWLKPVRCPKGLNPEDYALLPETLPVREIRYRVMVKGCRTSEVVLSTTLLEYSAEALADLYFQRWQVEADFRHIKITMQLDVCRGKSPDVVEKEFWAHVLAYNLLRRLMWESGDTWDGDLRPEPQRRDTASSFPMDTVLGRAREQRLQASALPCQFGEDAAPPRKGGAACAEKATEELFAHDNAATRTQENAPYVSLLKTKAEPVKNKKITLFQ